MFGKKILPSQTRLCTFLNNLKRADSWWTCPEVLNMKGIMQGVSRMKVGLIASKRKVRSFWGMFPLVLNYLLKCELEISFPQIQVKSGLLIYVFSQFSSVQFSPSIMSNALRSHGLQHARLSCPSAAPRVYSNSCPLSRWCHPSIVSSIISFSFCLQSFPASESFLVSQFFASGGQNNGVSASVLVLTMNTTNDFL